VQVQEVNRLLKEFEQMQGMMKKMKGGGLMKMMKKHGRHERHGRHAQDAVLILGCFWSQALIE
jgi:signal recognition particle GTPase